MPIQVGQLEYLIDTLQLVTNLLGPVLPGQVVETKIVSSLPELSGVDVGGSIPIARPVEVKVKWSVRDHNGNDLHLDKDFVATNALTGLVAGFILKPPIIELTRSVVFPFLWTIHAAVTVTAEGVTTPITKELEIPIDVMPIEIPRLLALFRHTDFKAEDIKLVGHGDSVSVPGWVLVVVPPDSLLTELSEPFNQLMERLDAVFESLRMLAGIAVFLTGLKILRHALAQPLVRFKTGDIPDLEHVHMRRDSTFGIDVLDKDVRAGDAVSSLILLGPCGTRVGCFDDEKWDLEDGEWSFNVVVGPELVTIVRSIESAKPPLSVPGNRVFMVQEGGDVLKDEMSSVKWDPDPTEEEKTLLATLCQVKTPYVVDLSAVASPELPPGGEYQVVVHANIMSDPPPEPGDPLRFASEVVLKVVGEGVSFSNVKLTRSDGQPLGELSVRDSELRWVVGRLIEPPTRGEVTATLTASTTAEGRIIATVHGAEIDPKQSNNRAVTVVKSSPVP